mmetsp:Transcript_30879/g.31420  ORF Transcript_30879/g.31420 Transcript_30879/m.31420 type:complete len:301 (+) Transcript_30879:215-1117(+)
MIFSQGERFKQQHKDAVCKCKCTEFWEAQQKSALGSVNKAPKMVPETYAKRQNVDKSSLLYPNIDPIRPRSATIAMKGDNRFGQNYNPGRDSPGPKYITETQFEKIRSYRNRSGTTFGYGNRYNPFKKKTDGEFVIDDALKAFNATQKRVPGAIIGGRLTGYISDDVPGPGAYQVKRDPVLTNRGPRMKPEYMTHKRPTSAVGYFDISRSFIKKSHSHAQFGCNKKVSCEHNLSHGYCCRNCCVLCKKSPSRVKIENPNGRRKSLGGRGKESNTESGEYTWSPNSESIKKRPISAPSYMK